MEKLHGAASRINKGLQHRLSGMARFGQSRHQAKEDSKKEFLATHGNLKGWNPGKTEGIYSLKTMEAYRQTANEFSRWAASEGVKNASQVSRELAAQYIQARQAAGVSAWTYSKDMSALNKVYNFDFTKKELGLQARHRADITRSRENTANDRRDLSAYQDHMTFAKGCGCRRESIDPNSIGKHVTPSDCLRNAEGKVIGVFLVEKGGKSRYAPVLNELKEELTRIVDSRAIEADKPLFSSYDSHIDNHAFRSEYATQLLKQLEGEKAAGLPLCQGDFDASKLCNLRGRDKEVGPTYRGHDTECAGIVSGALGHNRLEIVFTNYIR